MGQGKPGNPDFDKEVVSTEDIENLLGQLPGVVSSRLVVDDWGAIQEVHVLATSERGPKQLVRDVESTLAARWGINIDHKKISIAQMTGTDERDSEARLQLTGVTINSRVREAEVAVEVELAAPMSDTAYVGSHSGPGSRVHLVRTAAVATMQAVNAAIQPQHRVVLEEAEVITLHAYEIALAVVRLQTPGESQTLAGSALVRHDPVDAVIRACLDATNRRLSKVIGE